MTDPKFSHAFQCTVIKSQVLLEGVSTIQLPREVSLDARVKELIRTGHHMQCSGSPMCGAPWFLIAAALEIFKERPTFIICPVPTLTPAQQLELGEKIELFKVVAATISGLLRGGNKAWASKRGEFDYSVGEGLRVLGSGSGAKTAIVVYGSQVDSSSDAVLDHVAALAGVYAPANSGGMCLAIGFISLESGRVYWFNSVSGAEFLGFTRMSVLTQEGATRIMRQLLAPFPASPFID